MTKNVIIAILLIVLLAGFWFFWQLSQEQAPPFMEESKVQKITFTTSDGVQIVGNFYQPAGNIIARIVLFLPMMPATKESWDTLAKELQKKEVVSLAIDLRGHGESIRQDDKRLDYTKFSDEEHKASRLDVEAALEWLEKKMRLGLEQMSVVGASIGANLALQALGEHPRLGKAIALSPGLNYRGIGPKQMVESLEEYQAVFYVTSKDDGSNVKETEELYNATKGQKQSKIYDNAGHGTTMLERTEDLLPSIIEFILK